MATEKPAAAATVANAVVCPAEWPAVVRSQVAMHRVRKKAAGRLVVAVTAVVVAMVTATVMVKAKVMVMAEVMERVNAQVAARPMARA